MMVSLCHMAPVVQLFHAPATFSLLGFPAREDFPILFYWHNHYQSLLRPFCCLHVIILANRFEFSADQPELEDSISLKSCLHGL